MQIGKIAGVRFRFNIFFLIICVLYTYLGMGLEILIIVASVLLHEIAHTVMGSVLGIKVVEIELLPFGGQAKLADFTGLDPSKEIYIALAGPLISLSVAAFFYFLDVGVKHEYISYLIKINLLLGLFNLLPALPLDGGRILRSFLSPVKGFRQATSISANIGKILAVVIIGYGIYSIYFDNYGANFILIGILLFWAANKEKNLLMYAFMRYLVNKKGVLASKGFLEGVQIVSKKDTLVKDVLHTSRPNLYTLVFVVDDNNNVISIKTEDDLIEALLQKGPKTILQDC
ncbi:MAG TPA: M50 family metallopeptidase [Syntrophomonadaceae bacterium]|nr:M50 family metallopeptidase [Syntrophomonadaceae bacterium]